MCEGLSEKRQTRPGKKVVNLGMGAGSTFVKAAERQLRNQFFSGKRGKGRGTGAIKYFEKMGVSDYCIIFMNMYQRNYLRRFSYYEEMINN